MAKVESRNCLKRFRVRLRAWIWSVFGGRNGPDGAVSAPCEATVWASPGLFRQFLDGVLRSWRILREGQWVHPGPSQMLLDARLHYQRKVRHPPYGLDTNRSLRTS